MEDNRSLRSQRWASLCFVVGGLLMALFWLIYTAVHGPTSFDQTRVLLGRSTLFWSLLLSVPPSLLVALGLMILYPYMARDAADMARIGYVLSVIALIVPAGVDLFVWGGLGPPFFVPVVGTGLILLALGSWRSQQLPRHGPHLLMFMGICQFVAFALALIPNDVSDPIDGYRIFGLVAYLVTGLGWALFGAVLWKWRPTTRVE